MVCVDFYEKPGCSNNARQKRMLETGGHTVIAHNLLTTVWSAEELSLYFNGMPVAQWFNCNAPAIKQGSVDPEAVDAEQALRLMLAEPLLIRRPLLRVGGKRCAGFDLEMLASWIGIKACDAQRDQESCLRQAHGADFCR